MGYFIGALKEHKHFPKDYNYPQPARSVVEMTGLIITVFFLAVIIFCVINGILLKRKLKREIDDIIREVLEKSTLT